MKRLSGLAVALALAGLPAEALAVTGAVDLAPLSTQETPIVSRDNRTLSGFYLAGRQAGLSKDLIGAANFYTAALEKDPENPELLDRALLLNIASGNITKAAELATPVLERAPEDQLALLALSVARFRTGAVDEAIAHTQKMKGLGGPLQALIGTLLEAWMMAENGQPAQAISLLDELEGPAWVGAFTRLHAGMIADQAGLFEISRSRLGDAYADDSTDLRLVEAYARTLARAGDKAGAIGVIDNFQRQTGAIDRVTERLREAIETGDVAPHVATPRTGLAEALYGIGRGVGNNDNTLAASMLQLSLFVTPNADFPAMALGSVLESMSQHQAAIDVYRMVPSEAALHREASMQEALNLNVLKRHEEAIALLDDLVEEDPDDVAAAVALGNVHRSLEQFAEAATVYGSAIDAFDEVPPQLWTLFYYRGIALERTDRWREAEADFRKALELSPEHPLVLNYLGYSYIDRGENLDEAVDMVRGAVEQRPDDGYIVDSLGWAFYRLGRYEDAVEQLERAVSLRPGDPVINDHLGDAYWKVGRKLEATFQWAHARDSDPDAKELPKILRKLAVGLDAADEETTDTAEADPVATEDDQAPSTAQ
ncbi:MAG: tetratricopeptide repeat protein [Acuticoccus sp.]